MHQQNPNYRPFWQHLRSKWGLTRGRGRGRCRTQMSTTTLGHRSVITTLNKALNQVEYCALQQQIYAQSFLFSSVPNNHSFRSRQRNHLLAQGYTWGSMLQQHTNKTLTTSPFGNTCEANEVSPEVEPRGFVGLKCLQPSWDTDMWLQHLNRALSS